MSHRPFTPIPCESCPKNRRCDFVVCFMRPDAPSPLPAWALPRPRS